MSNDPTRPTGFWDINKERIKSYLLYFVLSIVVSELFDIGLVVAAIWCLLIFPAWWLVKRLLRRD